MKGLDGIHKKGIIHRDLKLQNILIDNKLDSKEEGDLQIYISDFGFATRTSAIFNNMRCGTPGYAAPEVYLECCEVTEKSDIFSLGSLIYRLCTGIPLIQGFDLYQVRDLTLNMNHEQIL